MWLFFEEFVHIVDIEKLEESRLPCLSLKVTRKIEKVQRELIVMLLLNS